VILHRLIRHHLRHGADREFYRLQARDAIRWLELRGLALRPGLTVLDLGCGDGTFGLELLGRGCAVTFADAQDWLPADAPRGQFRAINLDCDDLGVLGRHDVIICSNVIEHLRHPEKLLAGLPALLNAGGHVYLSWTNWLSPWGGHDFSPFHYLGPSLGPKVFDRICRRPRQLRPGENLFVTHIGRTLRFLRAQPALRLRAIAPRYYPELAVLLRVPILREFLAWNCAILLARADN
jgi:SAM-dependent methyltransferase